MGMLTRLDRRVREHILVEPCVARRVCLYAGGLPATALGGPLFVIKGGIQA